MISITVAFFINSAWNYYSNELPSVDEIVMYRPKTINTVLDRDGQILGVIYDEKREFVPITKIPKLVQVAFISAEDKNFYKHSGYDSLGLLKALVHFLMGQKLRGASTITQQITKGFLLSGERSFERKIKELILSTRLEKVLSKDQILEIYLNEVYLGEGAFGISAAASTYFAKNLNELLPSEAAFLAALPKSPESYSPKSERDNAIHRRNFVLTEMVENGYLSELTLESAKNYPLETVQGGEIISGEKLKLLKGFLAQGLIPEVSKILGDKKIIQGGLTIQTSIDPNLQKIARTALKREMDRLNRVNSQFKKPITRIQIGETEGEFDWVSILNDLNLVDVNSDHDVAVVLRVEGEQVWVGANRSKEIVQLHFWENSKPNLKIGDVVHVQKVNKENFFFPIRPENQKITFEVGIIVSDLFTGKILAFDGGPSSPSTSFNKITKMKRPRREFLEPFFLASVLQQAIRKGSKNSKTFSQEINSTINLKDLLDHISSKGNSLKASDLQVFEEISANPSAQFDRKLFYEETLKTLSNLGVIEQSSIITDDIKIKSNSTIFESMAAYTIFFSNSNKRKLTMLDAIYSGEQKLFPYDSDKKVCDTCDQDKSNEAISGVRNVLFDPLFLEDQRGANIIRNLLNFDEYEIIPSSDNQNNVVLTGKHKFDQELSFDSLIGVVSDKVFGCHIELEEPNLSLNTDFVSGACLSLVSQIVSQEMSR